MKLSVFFISVFLGSDVCTGQYGAPGYEYNYSQRRVNPNYQTDRVRQKPRYGRVNPNLYQRIMNRQGSQQNTHVVVYPKQQPVYRVHPKYQQRPVQQQTYNPYYQKVRNPYIQPYQKTVPVYKPPQYKPKWPKLRGRCKAVPNIKIDGVNPIRKECSRGHAVVVFLMKRRCDFCYHQLRELNKLAKHYKAAGKPLSVVVINHKRGPLAPAVIAQFPDIKIYEEPGDKDLFGKLGGAWRQIIVYDVCCRKQYLYGYPFSWMGYSFVRHAIFNTLYYDQVICGVCEAPTPATNTTTAATSA